MGDGKVTVCIPSIPPRTRQLARAVGSATRQNRPPDALSIAVDRERQGAWVTRTRSVRAAQTEWVALLDDDDWFYPQHLETLLKAADENPGYDYIYTYFDVHGGTDPINHFGEVFDPENPIQTTTTILIKADVIQEIGWRPPEGGITPESQYSGEDFQMTMDCVRAGIKILHVPERTWCYVHSREPGVGNTSGMPNRW